MPVNKLLVTMSLPIVISMLIQAMYNLVDSVFVAQINPDALTAVGMAFPMQSLMIAFQTGLGVGMNALVSRYLGQKKPYEAGLAATHALILTALNYVIFLIVGLTAIPAFFSIQTHSEIIADTVLNICQSYAAARSDYSSRYTASVYCRQQARHCFRWCRRYSVRL